ncbi:MAG: hypothetical protein U0350_00865 [Caldilineaceae bacterium]
MRFQVYFTTDAEEDLAYFKIYEQRIIIDAIKQYLYENADQESGRRKKLQPNVLALWELKVENYRVFYDFEEVAIVWINAIGYKKHNDLFIRGQKVKI